MRNLIIPTLVVGLIAQPAIAAPACPVRSAAWRYNVMLGAADAEASLAAPALNPTDRALRQHMAEMLAASHHSCRGLDGLARLGARLALAQEAPTQ